MDNVQKLRRKIEEANQAYRTGEAVMSDAEYDALLDTLAELTGGKDELLSKTGYEVSEDERRENLPVEMYSMNKIKSAAELHKWAELKSIPPETVMVITPKYDGLSLCVSEGDGRAWTRGNGKIGQRSDRHFARLKGAAGKARKKKPAGYTTGEMIMKRSVFLAGYAERFRNSRNMGSGMINAKEIRDELADFEYLRFAVIPPAGEEEAAKTAQLEQLNTCCNSEPVPYKSVALKDIDDDLLEEVFVEFDQDYEIDGLIIEVNDPALRFELGREKNGNPVYARAWKGFQEQSALTLVNAVDWQVSKHGLLKPVGRIEPVELDGVTVSNVTLINARYVKENGLGAGSRITVIRSGQVIPKVIAVVESTKAELPKKCPSCGTKTVWNENSVELVCPSEECEERQVQRLLAFFTILEVENMADGVIRQFYNAGYTTVKDILDLSREQLEELEGFQKKKAALIYNGIRAKISDVPLEKLMHATSVFTGLGQKKLALLKQFNRPDSAPSLEDVSAVDGFSEKTAAVFVDAFADFWKFIEPLPVTIKKEKARTSELSGWQVVFTGVRRKDLETVIVQAGGRVTSSVSKKTTHLVTKEKGSGSSKEEKAADLGIPVLTEAEFESELSAATA